MRRAPLALALLAAGCGGGGPASDSIDDPVAINVISATAEGTPAALAAALDCGNLPDFVPVPDGANVTRCTAGPDGRGARHVSGNTAYTVDAPPEAVIADARARAEAAGLAPGESSLRMFSAGEEAGRSLRVVVTPRDGGSYVVVTWGSGY